MIEINKKARIQEVGSNTLVFENDFNTKVLKLEGYSNYSQFKFLILVINSIAP